MVAIICPYCGSNDIAVARDMKATRHCAKCHRTWLPVYSNGAWGEPRPLLPEPTPPKSRGWIGVDFDGTLAEYHSWEENGHAPGRPIKLMVERVQRWLADGVEVRIFTARVSCGENEDPMPAHRQRVLIQRWCLVHIGMLAERIAVTNKKDFDMVSLWDDRAVAVLPNTGIIIGDHRDR